VTAAGKTGDFEVSRLKVPASSPAAAALSGVSGRAVIPRPVKLPTRTDIVVLLDQPLLGGKEFPILGEPFDVDRDIMVHFPELLVLRLIIDALKPDEYVLVRGVFSTPSFASPSSASQGPLRIFLLPPCQNDAQSSSCAALVLQQLAGCPFSLVQPSGCSEARLAPFFRGGQASSVELVDFAASEEAPSVPVIIAPVVPTVVTPSLVVRSPSPSQKPADRPVSPGPKTLSPAPPSPSSPGLAAPVTRPRTSSNADTAMKLQNLGFNPKNMGVNPLSGKKSSKIPTDTTVAASQELPRNLQDSIRTHGLNIEFGVDFHANLARLRERQSTAIRAAGITVSPEISDFASRVRPVHRCNPDILVKILEHGHLLSTEFLETLSTHPEESAFLQVKADPTCREILKAAAVNPNDLKDWISSSFSVKAVTGPDDPNPSSFGLKGLLPQSAQPGGDDYKEKLSHRVDEIFDAILHTENNGIKYPVDRELGTHKQIFSICGPHMGIHYGQVIFLLSPKVMYHPDFNMSPSAGTSFASGKFRIHHPWLSDRNDREPEPMLFHKYKISPAASGQGGNEWVDAVAAEYALLLHHEAVDDLKLNPVYNLHMFLDSHFVFEGHLPSPLPLSFVDKIVMHKRTYLELTQLQKRHLDQYFSLDRGNLDILNEVFDFEFEDENSSNGAIGVDLYMNMAMNDIHLATPESARTTSGFWFPSSSLVEMPVLPFVFPPSGFKLSFKAWGPSFEVIFLREPVRVYTVAEQKKAVCRLSINSPEGADKGSSFFCDGDNWRSQPSRFSLVHDFNQGRNDEEAVSYCIELKGDTISVRWDSESRELMKYKVSSPIATVAFRPFGHKTVVHFSDVRYTM